MAEIDQAWSDAQLHFAEEFFNAQWIDRSGEPGWGKLVERILSRGKEKMMSNRTGIANVFERVLSMCKVQMVADRRPPVRLTESVQGSSPVFRPAVAERGAAILEFALTLPIAMVVLTGLLSFGVYLNKSLELTNATSLAGQYLAVSRGSSAALSDPCAEFVSAFQNVAPFLQASALSYSFAFNSTSPAFTGTYSGNSCTAGAGGMLQGASATIKVTYPCSLGIFGVDLAPGCQLQSQVTEIVQ